MQRRQFLQSSLLGLSALHWFGCAGPKTLATENELTQLHNNTLLARATSAGKPLLVLLVPDKDDWAKSYRGGAYGYFFSEGSNQDVALLGLCEIVCASRETLAKIVPEVTEDDWMVLFETDGSSPAHRMVRRDPADGLCGIYNSYTKYPLDSIANLFRGALFADEAMKKRRVEQCQKSNKDIESTIANYIKRPSRQPLEVFDRGAALLMQSYEQKILKGDWRNERPSKQTEAELRSEFIVMVKEDPNAVPKRQSIAFLVASAASVRLLKTPPEGSEWRIVLRGSCLMCGMGNIVPSARKFLNFLTELPETI